MSKDEKIKKNIIPPSLLEYISNNCDANDRQCILQTLNHVNKLMKKSIKEEVPISKDNVTSNNKEKIAESESH
ncbi:protealysin propeptide domain-containing protein [Xenorhabdus szentirmaii]|uniref:Protealysin N-terminal propeptide domain-containing protein n=2 Tax=Xenorhabdus szentirmaii TaxID=290112 RepID=W1IU49_9GAMM|nr:MULTISPECIES: protealysin propeptide domain-containing protein [Xenorhabdus]MBD2782463.1 hypothetical protein [Xenorhabdus sp. 38]MBD2792949.1 hypothetical protein [Xenorhabdus sp. CUL]MBD2800877.1 hypothetical protein [Xenorhabdus sp. M]MBD2806093.1 hypothetical protein [Xenorhabdus sp. ZM]MBD2820478.1 hypothetical protein [Xenorhabdus sp. 42]